MATDHGQSRDDASREARVDTHTSSVELSERLCERTRFNIGNAW